MGDFLVITLKHAMSLWDIVLLNTLLFVYSVLNVDINLYIKVQNLTETD